MLQEVDVFLVQKNDLHETQKTEAKSEVIP